MGTGADDGDAGANWRFVRGLCAREGFTLAGACGAEASERRSELERWLAEGKHGSMAWLARDVDTRCDVRRLLDGARSVVVVADRYARRGEEAEAPGAPAGRVARYAHGRDYHGVMKDRLFRVCDALRERFAGHATRAFVDTAPVAERELAARAGLGWIGKHTLLIHPREGSYLVLGGFVTTLAIERGDSGSSGRGDGAEQAGRGRSGGDATEGSGLGELVDASDRCGACTRCIDACPTGAISAYSVDARRCVSYLTIERRAGIAPVLEARIGDWVFGCDVCQEVCPYNSPRRAHGGGDAVHGAYARGGAGVGSGALEAGSGGRGAASGGGEAGARGVDSGGARRLDPLAVLGWDGADRARELKGSAMKRATLAMLRRNAAIVIGNAGAGATNGCADESWRDEAVRRLRHAAEDAGEDAMVREAAARALKRIAAGSGGHQPGR